MSYHVCVSQWAYLGGLLGGDFGHVHLDVLEHAVGVEVGGHLVYEVEPVAHVDERAGVGQLGLDQELLHLLGVVHCTVPTHPLDLLQLLHARSCLDILLVHHGRLVLV